MIRGLGLTRAVVGAERWCASGPGRAGHRAAPSPRAFTPGEVPAHPSDPAGRPPPWPLPCCVSGRGAAGHARRSPHLPARAPPLAAPAAAALATPTRSTAAPPLRPQVSKTISQMVMFIKQEAEEKAAEIAVSAEEEFNITKLQVGAALRVLARCAPCCCCWVRGCRAAAVRKGPGLAGCGGAQPTGLRGPAPPAPPPGLPPPAPPNPHTPPPPGPCPCPCPTVQLLEAEKARIRKEFERREGTIEVKKKVGAGGRRWAIGSAAGQRARPCRRAAPGLLAAHPRSLYLPPLMLPGGVQQAAEREPHQGAAGAGGRSAGARRGWVWRCQS